MRLAVGAEPCETRIGEPRLAAGGRFGNGERRRTPAQCRAARSVSVVRPGHAAAVGKQRATRAGSRSTTSMSAPPMYEAIALMPIRARVLRRPASNAAMRWPTVSVGVSFGAARAGEFGRKLDREPRVDRGRANREKHRQRVDVEESTALTASRSGPGARRPSAPYGPRP